MAIDAQEFQAALEAIEVSKGISRETVLAALEEAMVRGYKKELGGDDAIVKVVIDPDKGILELYQGKNVVKEVEDDFLEISVEDANAAKDGHKYKEGDLFLIQAPIDTLRKATALSIKSILKQKFAEAEKSILFEAFKDKVDTMITGKVEKCDERGCSINIGRTSVYLPKNQMIGDERFNPGDPIRLYVVGVEAGSKGAHIVVSRSNEGFLKHLFIEEIREIYDGTIVIKGISREAGERSKIAVYSQNPDVDPAGACIGPAGSKIQKIVSQLGNGAAVKEKIDVIAYSDNPGLYIMEALKPARIAGVSVDEENKTAVAVVKDDSLSLAIGRRGVNARLAVRLTGYNIDIKTETDAIEEGIAYQTFEELQAEEIARKAEQASKASLASGVKEGAILPGLPEGYVAPQERVYEEERNDFDETLAEQSEKEELLAPAKEEKVEEAPAKEEKEAPKVKEKKEEVVETKAVKTTTTLSDLEKSLEDEASKSKKQTKKYSRKKKDSEEEKEESALSNKVDPKTYMSIYTEEELREMEEEDEENLEEEYDDEDVDYDEYDQYYDDDDK